jgi:hypothetical protein
MPVLRNSYMRQDPDPDAFKSRIRLKIVRIRNTEWNYDGIVLRRRLKRCELNTKLQNHKRAPARKPKVVGRRIIVFTSSYPSPYANLPAHWLTYRITSISVLRSRIMLMRFRIKTLMRLRPRLRIYFKACKAF